MPSLPANFWPSARQFAEAVQCPSICFAEPTLRGMLPAVDRLGMPLVTSGQFAYVFKLNAPQGGESIAVRCFRGFLGDREARYHALDAHLAASRLASLPRFRYFPHGILVAGRRYPALVMEWIAGPTLDVYLEETVGRREVLLHLAGEWLRLMSELRAAGVAHGDLQHGNVIVERGRLRLVDLDGMFVPALEGVQSSEVGHQHYQHPARDAAFFSLAVDNFSALVVYLSLVALAERPSLWAEHHDENLIFKRADFADPDSSALFRQVRELGGEPAALADALASAAKAGPAETPWLLDLVQAQTKLPAWMTAPEGVEVGGRTREVARAELPPEEFKQPRPRGRMARMPAPLSSGTVQTIFGSPSGNQTVFGVLTAAQSAPPAPRDPLDIGGNTFAYAKQYAGKTHAYIWWLLAHNLFAGSVWGAVGIGEGLSLILTLALFVVIFFVVGLARALYEAADAKTTIQPSVVPPSLSLHGPPPPWAASVSAQAATGQVAAGARGAPPSALFSGGPGATQPAPPPSVVGPGGVTPTASSVVAPQVVGNRSLSIYHLPACVWVDKIAARNRADFDSPESAQLAGYRPCRVCLP
jgi:Metal binding domain of Ada